MSIEIRLLTAGDEQILQAPNPDVFDSGIDPGALRRFLADDRHHIAVAIDDGVVVGFVSAVSYEHPDKPQPELWINEVGVAESHHRRGIGASLMQAMLAKGRALGCSEAWVLTNHDNKAAQALYSACGAGAPAEALMFTFPLAGEIAR